MISATADGAPSETTTPIDAATIVLLRDGQAGPEVFMLERTLKSDFAGGAYVFPGGKVADFDYNIPDDRWTGLAAYHLVPLLGAADERELVALYVAAVRETFEEAGVLLGTRAGKPITAEDLAAPSFVEARALMNSREQRFDWRDWLVSEDIVLDLSTLGFWAWWCTPDGPHPRFDTRFFAAIVPADQAAALKHDDVETTASRWLTPQAALDMAADGTAVIIYPTRRNLTALLAYDSSAAVVDACLMGLVDQRRIKPRARLADDGTVLIEHPDGGPPEAM